MSCSHALFKRWVWHRHAVNFAQHPITELVLIAGDMYFASAAENVQVNAILCIRNDKLKFMRLFDVKMSPYIPYYKFLRS